jgi:hypothetical protein
LVTARQDIITQPVTDQQHPDDQPYPAARLAIHHCEGATVGLFKTNKAEPADSTPAPTAEYKVIYKGGLAELPKAKHGIIMMQVWGDHFAFEPGSASRKFWQPLAIPYAAVSDVEIAQHQVGTAQSLLTSGSGQRNLEQDNNLHFHYTTTDGRSLTLRMEMLTGVSVAGQARKAAEFNDLLQARGIRTQFRAAPAQPGGGSLADELSKLQQLATSGVLTPDEFAAAKARLLGQ